MLAAGHSFTSISKAIGFIPQSIYDWAKARGLRSTIGSASHPHYYSDSEIMAVWQGCMDGQPYQLIADGLGCTVMRIRTMAMRLEISNNLSPHQTHRLLAEHRAQTQATPKPQSFRRCQDCGNHFHPASPYLFRCDPCKVEGLGVEGFGIASRGYGVRARAGA